jgi:glycerophosphoryl diester phosphodiesterase
MSSEAGLLPEGCTPVPPAHPSQFRSSGSPRTWSSAERLQNGRVPVEPGTDGGGTVFGGGPTVIGHRGLGCGVVAGHPENTLGSFSAAAALGAPWVEVDVRRTADDVLVVAHDAEYADGIRIADLRGGETDDRGTLRLDDLLEELPPGVGVDLDLKSAMEDCLRSPDGTTAGLLGPVAAQEAARRSVMVSSFDPGALQQVRGEAPRVPLAWLTWRQFPLEAAVAGCGHLDVDVLGVHVGSLSRNARSDGGGGVDIAAVARAVSLVHGCGRELLVWCPDPERAQVLVGAGADAVVVDEVSRALGALRPAA